MVILIIFIRKHLMKTLQKQNYRVMLLLLSKHLTSNKQGRQSVIVDRIGYDKEGHTVYTKLGNGTETTYTYDKQRERLQVMNLTADGQTVMENRYRYDAVDNILGITNAANPTSLTKLNKAKLGGRSSHTYEYDELNRLVHANACIV